MPAGVLELLNCLLSAGEVPGLYGPDELTKELAALDAKRTADSHYQVRHTATHVQLCCTAVIKAVVCMHARLFYCL
jgi:hypothetical protein